MVKSGPIEVCDFSPVKYKQKRVSPPLILVVQQEMYSLYALGFVKAKILHYHRH